MSKLVTIAGRSIDIEQHDGTRFNHVVKHLYAARQRWDLAVPSMPSHPRAQARASGCRPSDLQSPVGFSTVCEPCRLHVLADHDRHYLPAALGAVETGVAAGHHARYATRRGTREEVVGANAVRVFLRVPDNHDTQAFITALRDPPSGRNPTNEDFHKKAVRKLRDKASLGSGDPA